MIYQDGVWATAKITEAPKQWVIERDDNNPIWNEFVEYYNLKDGTEGFYFFSDKIRDDDILNFKDHQFLTLEQWKTFVQYKDLSTQLIKLIESLGKDYTLGDEEINLLKNIFTFINDNQKIAVIKNK